MKISKISLAAAVATALFSSAAMADSWTITQTVTPGGATTITQTDSASSYQSLNTINSSAATVLGGSSQTIDTANGGLTLQQSDDVGTASTGSTQAANLAIGLEIGEAGKVFTQADTGTSGITLNQVTAGTGNTQAFNAAVAGTVTQLNQSILGAIDLTQNGVTGAGNAQAGNLIDASDASASTSATAGDVTQSITDNLTLTQGTAGTGPTSVLQAGNALITGGTGGAIDQSVASTIVISQSGASSSHQAANYVGTRLP